MRTQFSAVTILLLLASFFVSGCIPPSGGIQPNDSEVPLSLIQCDENPEIVDGDLTTSSRIVGPNETGTPRHPFTVIKFRNPVYVTFIEVYTKDRLATLNISSANISDTESKAIPWREIGASVDVEKDQTKRIAVRSKVNMMKLTASWIRDNTKSRDLGAQTIPVNGPEIYEIKFYTNQASGGK